MGVQGKVKLSPACKLDHSELEEYKSKFGNKRGDKPLVAMSPRFILLGKSFKCFNNILYFI